MTNALLIAAKPNAVLNPTFPGEPDAVLIPAEPDAFLMAAEPDAILIAAEPDECKQGNSGARRAVRERPLPHFCHRASSSPLRTFWAIVLRTYHAALIELAPVACIGLRPP